MAWHVASLKPQLRITAAEGLEDKGFPTFQPKLVLRCTPREVVKVPLFGPYIFVAFPPGPKWVDALYVPGVQSILRWPDGRPQVVRCGYVEALMRHGDTETDSARLDRIEPGTKLRISRGPLAGLTGVCVTSTRERVRVLLNVMGGAPADVAAEAVEVGG